jgi:Phage tail protein
MIHTVETRNIRGALLTLPIDDISQGLILESVDGLHPVKATIVSSSFANMDAEQYHSSRRTTRDVKLTLKLEPDYEIATVGDLRKGLYGYFMPKSLVNLKFSDTDGTVAHIDGFVETCEAPLWTDEPKMEVVVRCLDSDFVDLDETVFSGTTVSTVTNTPIDYAGSVETGFEFVMNVNRTLTSFSIYMTGSDGVDGFIDFAYNSLVAGDVLTINTVPGAKEVTLLHAGVESSVLYAVSPQSNWLELKPGLNQIRVAATGAAIPFSINYTNKYGGL